MNPLTQGRSLQDNSVSRVEPFIGADGLLRVGERLRHADLGVDQKNPILLSRDCEVTELIVREIHSAKVGDSDRKRTVATLRVHARDRPFTRSGVDCFGPFLVKQGRARTKSLWCLLTCMSTRAIHLEVLNSLDADAFINTMTRFFSRRGPPCCIRLDNGTNMIGANKELRETVQEWNNSNGIESAFLQKNLVWEFNPLYCLTYGWNVGTTNPHIKKGPSSSNRHPSSRRRTAQHSVPCSTRNRKWKTHHPSIQ